MLRPSVQVSGFRYAAVLVVSLISATLHMRAFAAAGDLDLSFNGTGVAPAAIAPTLSPGSTVIIQPDGKIVAGGYISFGIPDFALVRYNSDGSLDTAFNQSGIARTHFGSTYGYSQVRALALQVDGKILAAGYATANDGPRTFALARYNVDGTLDPTLNGTGKVMTQIYSDGYGAYSLAVQPDGKILVGGIAYGWRSFVVLIRYLANGTLDTTFNGTGEVIAEWGSSVVAIAVQPNGKILALANGEGPRFGWAPVLARYNENGTLDTDFGSNGFATIRYSATSIDTVFSISLQPDGKIVVGGQSGEYGHEGTYGPLLVRYLDNGVLDASFNGTGMVSTPISGWMGAYATVQSDGKIVSVGSSSKRYLLTRHNSDGSLDHGFNNNGIAVSTVVGDYIAAVTIQSDGKIVAGLESEYGYLVARFLGDGPVTPGDGPVTTKVVEYYHAPFDHYFMTPVATEIALLDTRTPPFQDWTRTGKSFNAYESSSAPAGSATICRFFNDHFAPKSSHFYAAHGLGCETTLAQFPDWQLETDRLFSAMLPSATGDCSPGTVPVYRVYNQGQGGAPNHRFVTTLLDVQTMISRGYASEGTVMCVPP